MDEGLQIEHIDIVIIVKNVNGKLQNLSHQIYILLVIMIFFFGVCSVSLC